MAEPVRPVATTYQIHARILRTTDKAVKIRYAGQDIWLPKSHVRMGDAHGADITPIWLPLWLARKKGIVTPPRPRRRP